MNYVERVHWGSKAVKKCVKLIWTNWIAWSICIESKESDNSLVARPTGDCFMKRKSLWNQNGCFSQMIACSCIYLYFKESWNPLFQHWLVEEIAAGKVETDSKQHLLIQFYFTLTELKSGLNAHSNWRLHAWFLITLLSYFSL